MDCKRILCSLLVLLCAQAFAGQKIIAIDSWWIRRLYTSCDLASENLILGMHRYSGKGSPASNVFVGNIYNPAYLKTFLKNVEIYYQMAAITSINSQHTLEEYILTNSIAPYLASRVNKSMTVIAISSIAINDVDEK